jgi:hypothetical protein
MKKLIYLILIFPMLAGFLSCKKSFLDEKSDSAYSPLTTFKNVAGLEAGIAGLQASVREQYTMQATQSLLAVFQVGTDVALNGLDAGEAAPFENYALLNSESPAVLNYWNWSYKVINNANLIIKGASDSTAVLTLAQRAVFLGEARFYRAYAYNFLVTLWGQVPLIDQPLDAPKTDFTRASLESLNNLINDDLLYATTNLPNIDAVSKPGRISKEAAQQLLAEAYLRQGKNDLAETQCLNIITGRKFAIVNARFGIKKTLPGDAFSDMFIVGNQRRRQGNTEAIWVQEMEYNIPGGSSSLDQHRRVWVPYYSNVPGMLVADSLGGRGIGRLRLSPWVINGLYKGTDMRNSVYNIKRNFYYNDSRNAKFGQKVIPLPADTLYKIVPYTTKWNHYLEADPTGNGAYKDLIMMRLGETYLLLAEAQLKQSKTGDAAITINVLRTRANAAQVLASDMTMDFILDERVRELVGEENRRMTLARTGTLVARLKKLNFIQTSTVQPFHQLLPIPQSEIDLNKDAVLTQNLGYIR